MSPQDPTPTPDQTALERRLVALELKASDAEDQIDQLNLALYRQQQRIDALLRELSQLRDSLPAPGTGAVRSLRDELPPHY